MKDTLFFKFTISPYRYKISYNQVFWFRQILNNLCRKDFEADPYCVQYQNLISSIIMLLEWIFTYPVVSTIQYISGIYFVLLIIYLLWSLVQKYKFIQILSVYNTGSVGISHSTNDTILIIIIFVAVYFLPKKNWVRVTNP